MFQAAGTFKNMRVIARPPSYSIMLLYNRTPCFGKYRLSASIHPERTKVYADYEINNHPLHSRGNYTMSIVKNTPHYLKHSGSFFTTILNKTIEAITDPAALGIYLYLASKPDDWQISETNLKNRFNRGGDFIRVRLAELKRLGLLKSVAIKNAKGQVTRWETVLYNEIQPVETKTTDRKNHNTENPPSGENTHVVDPHITNKGSKQKKDINNLSHSVECDLFLEVEQQRKALMLRDKTVKHEKCKELYEKLPQEVKNDKSFEDVHDECVTHYATQTEPQMVSPQRLMSWIKREIKYHVIQPTKPASYQKPGDSFNDYMKSQKGVNTYDQHGNTYDPLR